MPLWIVYHPPNTFDTHEAKEAFAGDVTNIYLRTGLPAFYVVVKFISVDPSNVFVGGKLKTDKPFIRIVIDHIAFHSNDDTVMNKRTTAVVDAALKPHVADKGYDWEYHIDETPRGLWKINGFAPPPFKSEAEKQWVKDNKPSAWE
ncbi:putative oxalocrotonate tautomerase [Mariannaea sp. PMI_226]|nr:putative oxalocrotonate tautomerase [Mariannaea sp. PMI_226]